MAQTRGARNPRGRLARVLEKGRFLILFVFLRSVYFTVSVFWCWGGGGGGGVSGRRPSLHYRKDSQLCPGIARSCSTLTEKYVFPSSYLLSFVIISSTYLTVGISLHWCGEPVVMSRQRSTFSLVMYLFPGLGVRGGLSLLQMAPL